MEVIIKPRGSGKTTDLIRRCAKYGGYLVCPDREACAKAHYEAKSLDLEMRYPLTYHAFLKGKYDTRLATQVYIDNIDMFLTYISKVPVLSVTLASERVSVFLNKSKTHVNYKL